MNVDLLQLLYYAGFALLGWFLRHQGLLQTPARPVPLAPPALPIDQKVLIDLLKSLLDRLVQPPSEPTPPAPSAVFHVPIEVAATPRTPS